MSEQTANLPPSYRLFVNDDRTLLVRLWADDKTVEVGRRDHPSHTWGPPVYPVYLTEEKISV